MGLTALGINIKTVWYSCQRMNDPYISVLSGIVYKHGGIWGS